MKNGPYYINLIFTPSPPNDTVLQKNPKTSSCDELPLDGGVLPQLRQVARTYRRWGGRREKGQDPSTGDDDVVDHLRDEVDGVVDKNDVLVAINEVHDRFRGVAVGKKG